MEKKSRPLFQLGASYILVIFVILCLLIFAALSITSANADYRLSQKMAERTSQYYQANNEASRILAEIDQILFDTKTASADAQNYFSAVKDRLIKLPDVQLDQQDDALIITYQITINDAQSLAVCLQAKYPTTAGDSCYSILQWQSISTKEWDGSKTLDVIKG